MPVTRKIKYATFDASNLPGGKPQVLGRRCAGLLHRDKVQHAVKEQVKTVIF